MMDRRTIPVFRVKGIPIEINYSWILVFILVSANLALQWFPRVVPGREPFAYYALGVIGSLLLFSCVLAHELSHSLVALHGGSEVRGIILHVFGGVSLISEKHYTPGLEFRVAIAGPLLSIALGALFWLLRETAFSNYHSLMYQLLTYLFVVNLMLAAFNLLPGFPLDGGRVLRSLLALWKKDLVKATRIASRVGTILAYLLMAYGLLIVLNGNFWGIWTVLIGIFLKDAADTSYRHALMQNAFQDKPVKEIMQTEPVIIPPDLTIQELIDNYFWRYHYGSFPVGQEKALGIITFADIKKVSRDERATRTVRELMHPVTDSLRIRPDDTVLSAFEKASSNGVGRMLVVDDQDVLQGYLSLRDVAKAYKGPGERGVKS